MKTILNLLSKPWLNGIGLLIGLLGLYLWYIGYRSSKKGASLSYQVNSLSLIDKNKKKLPDDIRILFKNKDILRLTKTFIIIWNSGSKTLLGENIVSGDKPRIIFDKDSEVLNVQIVKTIRDVNKCNIEQDKINLNEVLFTFDYLDVNDGMCIEILHTGQKGIPKVKGTIKEMPKGILFRGTIHVNKGKGLLIFQIIYSVLILFIIYITIFANIIPIWLWGKEGVPSFPSRVGMIIVCLFTLVPIFFDLYNIKRSFPNALNIDDLSK